MCGEAVLWSGTWGVPSGQQDVHEPAVCPCGALGVTLPAGRGR